MVKLNEILFNDIIQLIRNKNIEYINESSITSLINGILYSFGWNVFDPYEVAPQYSVQQSDSLYNQYVDLAVKLYGFRKIFIEIKDTKKGKNLKRHEKQLEGYLYRTPDVKTGILTNAESWRFYNSIKDENNQIRIDLEDKINVIKDKDSDIENILSNYLSKERMVNEWYKTYKNILFSDNCHNSYKQFAILKLKTMKDKRVLEPLKRAFNEEEDDITRRSALDGIIELSEEKDLKPFLLQVLNDDQPGIRKTAEIHLENLNKEQKIKIQSYKSKFGIN